MFFVTCLKFALFAFKSSLPMALCTLSTTSTVNLTVAPSVLALPHQHQHQHCFTNIVVGFLQMSLATPKLGKFGIAWF
jgi:hypothetical protein